MNRRNRRHGHKAAGAAPTYRPMGRNGLTPFDQFTFCDMQTYLDITQALHESGATEFVSHLRTHVWINQRTGQVRALAPANRYPPPAALREPPFSLLLHIKRVHLSCVEEGGRA